MTIESPEDARYAVYIESTDPNAPGLLKQLCEELAERLAILGDDAFEVVLYGERKGDSEQQVIFWNPESVVEEWEIS